MKPLSLASYVERIGCFLVEFGSYSRALDLHRTHLLDVGVKYDL